MSQENKDYNRKLLLTEARNQLTDYLVKTSIMVDEGKLSNTAAKQIAGVGIDRYNKAVKMIEAICQ